MRIEDKKISQEIYSSQAQKAPVVQPTAQDQQTQVPRDTVQLSGRGREVQKVREAALEAPEVRESRVAELKSAIQAGTYNVRGEQIASKMLADNMVNKLF